MASSSLGARSGETTPATASLEENGTLASAPIAVPKRILMGPGPSNAHPRVLAAQGRCRVWRRASVRASRESDKAYGERENAANTTDGHQEKKPISSSSTPSINLDLLSLPPASYHHYQRSPSSATCTRLSSPSWTRSGRDCPGCSRPAPRRPASSAARDTPVSFF